MYLTETEELVVDDYEHRGYLTTKKNRSGIPDFLFKNEDTGHELYVEVKVGRNTVSSVPTTTQMHAIELLRNAGKEVKVLQIFLKRPNKKNKEGCVKKVSCTGRIYWEKEYTRKSRITVIAPIKAYTMRHIMREVNI